MAVKQEIHLSYLLSNSNFLYVCNYCTENDVPPKEALNMIVSDWRGGIEIEPLNTAKTAESEPILQNALETIENRLKAIETLVWYQLFNQVHGS